MTLHDPAHAAVPEEQEDQEGPGKLHPQHNPAAAAVVGQSPADILLLGVASLSLQTPASMHVIPLLLLLLLLDKVSAAVCTEGKCRHPELAQ